METVGAQRHNKITFLKKNTFVLSFLQIQRRRQACIILLCIIPQGSVRIQCSMMYQRRKLQLQQYSWNITAASETWLAEQKQLQLSKLFFDFQIITDVKIQSHCFLSLIPRNIWVQHLQQGGDILAGEIKKPFICKSNTFRLLELAREGIVEKKRNVLFSIPRTFLLLLLGSRIRQALLQFQVLFWMATVIGNGEGVLPNEGIFHCSYKLP